MNNTTVWSRQWLRFRKYYVENYLFYLSFSALMLAYILFWFRTESSGVEYMTFMQGLSITAALSVWRTLRDRWNNRVSAIARTLPMNDNEQFAFAWINSLIGGFVWFLLVFATALVLGYLFGWRETPMPEIFDREFFISKIILLFCSIHALAFAAAVASHNNVLRNYGLAAAATMLIGYSLVTVFPKLIGGELHLSGSCYALSKFGFSRYWSSDSQNSLVLNYSSGLPGLVGLWIMTGVMWTVGYFKFRENQLK